MRKLFLTLAFGLVLLGAAWVATKYAPVAPADGAPSAPLATGLLRVHVIDVGQGDATVWELPDGSLVVYDCGPSAPDAASNPLVRYVQDALQRPAGARLHMLVASHGHLDHVGGCEELLATYAFDHVVEAWYEGDDAPASYRRFLDDTRAEGAALHTLATLGGAADLPLPPGAVAAGVRAHLLWPSALPASWDDIAQASLVVRLTHGDSSFCFQGDIERAQERALAQRAGDLSCDFHLVGHHGSRYASDEAWLARMQPQVAVVSFGENDYGHPTSDALCRVQTAGASVYATHRAGNVVVASDAEGGVRVQNGADPETRDYCGEGTDYWSG